MEKATGDTFVAKFVNTPYPSDKQTVRNEVNMMNQLHHPKLLNLHDAFDDKDEMCLIMELYVPHIHTVSRRIFTYSGLSWHSVH